ncbi:MAG: hypothetical protein MJ246_00805 [Clostridia bacterium]|nr:hypothetical protein [Clostridia bacterium]
MCAISYQDEQSAQSGAAAMMKKVLYAAVDAGYSFLVDDNTDDAQLDKRYVYKKDSTHFG